MVAPSIFKYSVIDVSVVSCLVLFGKDIDSELDAVGCQYKTYPYCRMCLRADGALVV